MLCIIVLIAVSVASNAALAQSVASGSAEKVVSAKIYLSVDKLRPGDKFKLAVRATVAKGYHVGANDKDALYPAKLTIAAPKGVMFAEPAYPKGVRVEVAGSKLPVYEGTFTILADGRVDAKAKPGAISIKATLDTQACKGEQCYPPETLDLSVKTRIAPKGTPVKPANKNIFAATTGGGNGLEGRLAHAPLALKLLLLYGMGLLLAFTPCVYPMVPVTVGYFSAQGQSGNKKVALLAGVYVLGLALTYSVLGAVASIPGHTFGEFMQTHNLQISIGIAAILVALALSMFGLYEIQAPACIQSKASGRSGVAGALVMGLIFGVVVAPCAGPVVLALLTYVATLGSPVMGFALFFTLALGLGTPLFALAAFSAKLPVPGMWMVAVKKAAGFLLLGAAAYFLTPILPDRVAQYAIPVVLVAGGLYLAFFEKSIRASRVGASLGKATGMAALVVAVALAAPKPSKHSIHWTPYTPAAVTAAAKAHKPVMIDFTAKWCIACKELEAKTFSKPAVIKAVASFERLRVDGSSKSDPAVQAAARKFAVKGFPTVIFIDRSGSEVASARIVGFVDSQEMLKRIDSVK
jgi:thioredoxin:protein disulfide reductase